MQKISMISKVASTLILAIFATCAFAQGAEESAAQAAERTGKHRDALTHYLSALEKAAPGSADDQRLREQIISVAKKLKPAPALPEEAKRRMARGRAATKAAADPQGFLHAAEEFGLASKAAPWLPEAYFNSAIVLDKAGRQPDAIRNMKLYLPAATNPSEANQARELMYEMEFRQEKAAKDAAA